MRTGRRAADTTAPLCCMTHPAFLQVNQCGKRQPASVSLLDNDQLHCPSCVANEVVEVSTYRTMHHAPERGQAYPITLGATLTSDTNKTSKEYVSLRYTFRPNTVSRATTGILTLEHGLHDSSQAKGTNNPVKVRNTGQPDGQCIRFLLMYIRRAFSVTYTRAREQVYTQLPSVRDGEIHAFANGEYKDAQQDVDMVLLFDGKSLRMERLAASVTGLSCEFHKCLPICMKAWFQVIYISLQGLPGSSVRMDLQTPPRARCAHGGWGTQGHAGKGCKASKAATHRRS